MITIKVLQCRFQQCLVAVNTFTLEGCSPGQEIPKYLCYEADIFFQNAENIVQIPKMQ